jgi:hypothetical protein
LLRHLLEKLTKAGVQPAVLGIEQHCCLAQDVNSSFVPEVNHGPRYTTNAGACVMISRGKNRFGDSGTRTA